MSFLGEPMNFVDMINHHAQHSPHDPALIFLEDTLEKEQLTFKELHQKVSALAGYLLENKLTDTPLLLIYPAGLEFVIAFIACLYAGAIPVPVDFKPLQPLANEIKAKVILTETKTKALLFADKHTHTHLTALIIIETNALTLKTQTYTTAASNKIAYLQYTSGSTAYSKAVITSHQELTRGIRDISTAWRYDEKSVSLSWTPHTYSYGLVVGILTPLYNKSLTFIMSAQNFINHPSSWLTLISKYQVTHSGCPNFGYDLCAQHIATQELTGINLSRWKVAICAGETVQFKTLNQFYQKFKSVGFEASHFYPSFGISELSGLVATKKWGQTPVLYDTLLQQSISITTLEQENVNVNLDNNFIVSCGPLLPGITMKIVHPERKEIVPQGAIGEIWLSATKCFNGYWPNNNKTDPCFETLDKIYYKTGDLGFEKDGELFLTGRLKELIVIYGKKYTPMDIESKIPQAHSSIAHELNVAFSNEIEHKEALFILQEIDEDIVRQRDFITIVEAIKVTLYEQLGINPYGIILLKKGTIPKTNSGKVQRLLAKQLFIENNMGSILYQHIKNLEF